VSPEPRFDAVFPWGPQAGLKAAGWTGACLVGLLVAWYEIAGKGVFNDQVGWLSLAIGAVVVELYALSALILRGRRALGERRATLIGDEIAGLLGRAVRPAAAASVAPNGSAAGAGQVVVVPGSTLFHRADCPMTAGREGRPLGLADAVRSGATPCGVCGGGLPS
jgi:hypothetical protein